MGKRGVKPGSKRARIERGEAPYKVFNEITARAGIPDPPDLVREDPVAMREWHRVLGMLVDMNVITQVDGASLGMYCQVYARLTEAQARLRKEGLIVKNRFGEKRPNPLLAIVERAEMSARRMMAEFGLSPLSRTSIKATAPAKDAFEDFVKIARKPSARSVPGKGG